MVAPRFCTRQDRCDLSWGHACHCGLWLSVAGVLPFLENLAELHGAPGWPDSNRRQLPLERSVLTSELHPIVREQRWRRMFFARLRTRSHAFMFLLRQQRCRPRDPVMIAGVHVFPLDPEAAVDPCHHQVLVAAFLFDDPMLAAPWTPACAHPATAVEATGNLYQYPHADVDSGLSRGI